ncbi:RagB/SusD family nutrient uptake outer membrane protein [Mucilaginibacter psychrotolerans]|uniref:RagB/SusD family nutrient uptake outer membrane protein n=1 Tax=Mucilaginibacter psychrotolerans TaxID=1524096 RepID=A0A4Y8SI07_9SPHI|nr:RagB/SusD family nutrient uptake outer membrane protein [Mucilaginibacter psychrotolerans]TFF38177.1 RagB/SusD family nutrient uptake outer membrane protein [Mucilaginibacter psychrotolerans]
MKNHQNIIAALILILAIAGCKKYEQFPVDKVGIDKIFDSKDSAGVNAQHYLYGIYSVMKNGHNRVGGDYLDAASDDAISSASGPSNVATILSTASYNSYTVPTDENLWGTYYAGIRQANEFVNNIDVVPVLAQYNGKSQKFVWKAEARFLRAYFYFELIKRYGGVPLMGDKVLTITDDVSLPRNSFDGCVKYIVSECDAIQGSLYAYPLTNPASPEADSHRATKGAAMALKAKVLLYAASPLFNGGNIDGSNPLTGYASADAGRWAAAAAACKDVMDLGKYALLDNYKDVFITQYNPEILFFRQVGNNNSIETANGPIGFTGATGKGQTSPTQQLVDAFPMNNGLPITDAASGYDVNNPYANRDPRLTYNVIYNGAQWLNTSIQTYEGGQSKPNGVLQQTKTGYYMRKFMGNFETTGTYSSHSADWIILRYADMVLGYAEAQNEAAGATPEVYNALISIRKRAGLAAGTGSLYGLKAGMTKEEMRATIQNERRIEFAFEESRYWDIRRWKIAENLMNQPRTGISITKVGTSLNYNQVNVLATRFVSPKMYLYPIPYDEVQKNPNMKQNPGW